MPHVVGGKEEYSFEYLDLSPDFAKQVLCEQISQPPGASVSSRIKGDNTISIASFWWGLHKMKETMGKPLSPGAWDMRGT